MPVYHVFLTGKQTNDGFIIWLFSPFTFSEVNYCYLTTGFNLTPTYRASRCLQHIKNLEDPPAPTSRVRLKVSPPVCSHAGSRSVQLQGSSKSTEHSLRFSSVCWLYLPFFLFAVLVDFIPVFLEASTRTHLSTSSTLSHSTSAEREPTGTFEALSR